MRGLFRLIFGVPIAALELHPVPMVACVQTTLTFTPPRRGYHLITDEVNDVLGKQLHQFQHGMCCLFVQQMYVSLTINENSDPAIRDWPGASEVVELGGDNDTPSAPNSLGLSISIPITRGALALGPWQGIYLCQHRDILEEDKPRTSVIVITAQGQLAMMVSKHSFCCNMVLEFARRHTSCTPRVSGALDSAAELELA